MNESPALPEVLTDRQLAELFGLKGRFGYVTVQRLARSGKLRGQQVGTAWLFHRDAVRAFLLAADRPRGRAR